MRRSPAGGAEKNCAAATGRYFLFDEAQEFDARGDVILIKKVRDPEFDLECLPDIPDDASVQTIMT